MGEVARLLRTCHFLPASGQLSSATTTAFSDFPLCFESLSDSHLTVKAGLATITRENPGDWRFHIGLPFRDLSDIYRKPRIREDERFVQDDLT